MDQDNSNPGGDVISQPMKGFDEKFCESCGEIIKIKAEICPKCGVRQHSGVSKAALLLLTFFLGGFGAHKFYLKKYWQGVFYLLFSWTAIPAIIAFIEFIIYAFTSSERLQEKYTSSGSGVVVAVVVGVGFFMMIGILAAIAIPNFVSYRNKAYCSIVQTEAMEAATAIDEYYSNPGMDDIPTLDQLLATTGYVPAENVSVDIVSSLNGLKVIAYDNSGRCNMGKRYVLSFPETSDGGWQ